MRKQLIVVTVSVILGIALGISGVFLKSRDRRNKIPIASVKAAVILDEPKTVAEPDVAPPSPQPPEAGNPTDLAAQTVLSAESLDKVATLTNLLAQEVSNRQRLEESFAALRTKVSQLESAVAGGRRRAVTEPGPQENEAQETAEELEKESEARFLKAGFDRVSRAQLLKRADELAMERLNLRYQARREGWFRTPEYREAISELRGRMKNELGEDTYDRFLYASERSNRLLVDSVMESSPAQQFGLQAGDVIYRYDGNRIFSRRDLREATNRGNMGETVPVEIQRGGKIFEVELPRGPMGVRMDRSTVLP